MSPHKTTDINEYLTQGWKTKLLSMGRFMSGRMLMYHLRLLPLPQSQQLLLSNPFKRNWTAQNLEEEEELTMELWAGMTGLMGPLSLSRQSNKTWGIPHSTLESPQHFVLWRAATGEMISEGVEIGEEPAPSQPSPAPAPVTYSNNNFSLRNVRVKEWAGFAIKDSEDDNHEPRGFK